MGKSDVVLWIMTPATTIRDVPTAKLRLRKTRRSTSGRGTRISQQTKNAIETTDMPEPQQIQAALNQSSSWPRSRTICSEASQMAMAAKPT